MPLLSPRALAFLAGASHRLGVDLLLVVAPDEAPGEALCAVDLAARGCVAATLVAMGSSSCVPSAALRAHLEVIGDALVHLVEAEHEVRLHAAVTRNIPGGAAILFDADLRILAIGGEPLLAALGARSNALVGKNVAEAVREDLAEGTTRLGRAALAGRSRELSIPHGEHHLLVRSTPVVDPDGVTRSGLVVLVDVTRQTEAAAQNQRRADDVKAASLLDELTGVANRRGFLEAARAHHARASQESRPFLLLFADLDGLKPINDRQGHAAGDEAIRQVASILVATLRTGDVVARLAGDEFVVLAKDVGRESAVMLRARLLEAFETAKPRTPAAARLQVSVGFAAFVPGSGETLDALLARADAAMYFEKKRRKLKASAA